MLHMPSPVLLASGGDVDPRAEVYISQAGITNNARKEVIRKLYADLAPCIGKLRMMFLLANVSKKATAVNVVKPSDTPQYTEQNTVGYPDEFPLASEFVVDRYFKTGRGYYSAYDLEGNYLGEYPYNTYVTFYTTTAQMSGLTAASASFGGWAATRPLSGDPNYFQLASLQSPSGASVIYQKDLSRPIKGLTVYWAQEASNIDVVISNVTDESGGLVATSRLGADVYSYLSKTSFYTAQTARSYSFFNYMSSPQSYSIARVLFAGEYLTTSELSIIHDAIKNYLIGIGCPTDGAA